jgi:predicted ATPase
MPRRSARRQARLLSDAYGFLRSVRLRREQVSSFDEYPFSMPAIRTLDELTFRRSVTYFVGDNGSGKSTLIEAIAQAAGFNPEGGSKSFRLSHRPSESRLHDFLRITRGPVRERDGFFLRAETFFNAATYVESLDLLGAYGGRSLHEQSHGESFLTLAQHRFKGNSLFLLDEPEAALSPSRQLSFLGIMHQLVQRGSQFVIATHSPILLAYPDSQIYQFGPEGIQPINYEATEQFQITYDFLTARERFLRILLAPDEDEESRDAT